jgi:hypothetical protein
VYTLRLTRPLLADFDSGDDAAAGATPPTTALGDWYATGLMVGARDLVVCLSARSHLTIVFPRPSPVDLPQHLAATLVGVLRDIGVSRPAIAAELAEMTDGEIASASDRRTLGVLAARAALVRRLVAEIAPGEVDARRLHRALADRRVGHDHETCGARAARLLEQRCDDSSR